MVSDEVEPVWYSRGGLLGSSKYIAIFEGKIGFLGSNHLKTIHVAHPFLRNIVAIVVHPFPLRFDVSCVRVLSVMVCAACLQQETGHEPESKHLLLTLEWYHTMWWRM